LAELLPENRCGGDEQEHSTGPHWPQLTGASFPHHPILSRHFFRVAGLAVQNG
jgi:hypothetical protein